MYNTSQAYDTYIHYFRYSIVDSRHRDSICKQYSCSLIGNGEYLGSMVFMLSFTYYMKSTAKHYIPLK